MSAHTQHERQDGTFDRGYMCISRLHDCHAGRCRARRIPADLVEAMFAGSLRIMLPGVEQASSARMRDASGVLAAERQHLIDAVLSGDSELTDATLAGMVARGREEASRARRTGNPGGRDPELDVARRFETWAEEERLGRNDASRQEARALNRVLGALFSSITLAMDEMSVTIVATSRPTANASAPHVSEIRLDLREWSQFGLDWPKRLMPRRRWTDAEILHALRAWAEIHGRSPKRREWGACELDWVTGQLDHPSPATVKHHFTTWERALRKAGLKPAARHPPCRVEPGRTPSSSTS